MLAVGISRRTLRRPQALNGALRQFESVISRSGAGGKSSVCGNPITFQRGLNLNVAFVDAANSCKEIPLPAKRSFRQGTKGVVAAPSQLRTIRAPGTAAKQPN